MRVKLILLATYICTSKNAGQYFGPRAHKEAAFCFGAADGLKDLLLPKMDINNHLTFLPWPENIKIRSLL